MKVDNKKCPTHNRKYKYKCCQEYICSHCRREKHANHKFDEIKCELEPMKIETSKDLALIGDFINTYHKKIAELRLIFLQYKASTVSGFRVLREEIFKKVNEKILKIQNSVYEKLSQFEGKFQDFMNSNNRQICKVYYAESVFKRVYEMASLCLEKKCGIGEYVQLKKSINLQNAENLIKFVNGDIFDSQRNRFEKEGKEIEKFLEDSKKSLDIDNEMCNKIKMEYESIKNLIEELKTQKTTLQEEIRILREKNEEVAATYNIVKENKLKLQDEQIALSKEIQEKKVILESLKGEIAKLQNIDEETMKLKKMKDQQDLKKMPMKIGEEEKLLSGVETVEAKEACILSTEVINKY